MIETRRSEHPDRAHVGDRGDELDRRDAGHRGELDRYRGTDELREPLRVPVLAAGGIATARDLAAVLACGASGARIGTRFVAAAESGAHPLYVKALLAATAADTCLTEAYSVGWPDAPHRVLRSAIAAAERAHDDILGEEQWGGEVGPVQRFSVSLPSSTTTGRIEAMALYAGESVTHVNSVQPAAEIIAELVAGAERRLRETR